MAYRVKYKFTVYGETVVHSSTAELALQNVERAFKFGCLGNCTENQIKDPTTEFECISIIDEDTREEYPITKQWIEEDDDFLTRKEK